MWVFCCLLLFAVGLLIWLLFMGCWLYLLFVGFDVCLCAGFAVWLGGLCVYVVVLLFAVRIVNSVVVVMRFTFVSC